MKTCFETRIAGYDISLDLHPSQTFQVRYGAHVVAGLSYAEAATELGTCIMHALQCEGKIDDVEAS